MYFQVYIMFVPQVYMNYKMLAQFSGTSTSADKKDWKTLTVQLSPLYYVTNNNYYYFKCKRTSKQKEPVL